MEMWLLGRRLSAAGYTIHRFSYPSHSQTPVENADALADYCHRLSGPEINFICHSLGGLVLRHFFYRYPKTIPGRSITLGTPHNPSSSAFSLGRNRLGRLSLGKSIDQGLAGDVPSWEGCQELGVIAGTLRLGLGCLVSKRSSPGDGTVLLSEARLAGMTDYIELPVSHFGLLLSRQVARQCLQFLKEGRFSH